MNISFATPARFTFARFLFARLHAAALYRRMFTHVPRDDFGPAKPGPESLPVARRPMHLCQPHLCHDWHVNPASGHLEMRWHRIGDDKAEGGSRPMPLLQRTALILTLNRNSHGW